MDTPRASSSCPSRRDTAKKLLPVALILWTVGQAMAGGHDQARCHRCHGGGAAVGSVTLDREACTGCHVKAARGDGQAQALFHGDQSQSCVRCHRYHDADTVITPRGSLSLAALEGVDREHCRTCHQPQARRDRLSPGHEAAAALYHEHAADLAGLSPSAACRACHEPGRWRRGVAPRCRGSRDRFRRSHQPPLRDRRPSGPGDGRQPDPARHRSAPDPAGRPARMRDLPRPYRGYAVVPGGLRRTPRPLSGLPSAETAGTHDDCGYRSHLT